MPTLDMLSRLCGRLEEADADKDPYDLSHLLPEEPDPDDRHKTSRFGDDDTAMYGTGQRTRFNPRTLQHEPVEKPEERWRHGPFGPYRIDPRYPGRHQQEIMGYHVPQYAGMPDPYSVMQPPYYGPEGEIPASRAVRQRQAAGWAYGGHPDLPVAYQGGVPQQVPGEAGYYDVPFHHVRPETVYAEPEASSRKRLPPHIGDPRRSMAGRVSKATEILRGRQWRQRQQFRQWQQAAKAAAQAGQGANTGTGSIGGTGVGVGAGPTAGGGAVPPNWASGAAAGPGGRVPPGAPRPVNIGRMMRKAARRQARQRRQNLRAAQRVQRQMIRQRAGPGGGPSPGAISAIVRGVGKGLAPIGRGAGWVRARTTARGGSRLTRPVSMVFKRQSSRLLQAVQAELKKDAERFRKQHPGQTPPPYHFPVTGPQGGYIRTDVLNPTEVLDRVMDKIRDIEQNKIAIPKEALLKFKDQNRERLEKAKKTYQNKAREARELRTYSRRAARAMRKRDYQQRRQWAAAQYAQRKGEGKDAVANAKTNIAAAAQQGRTQALLQLAKTLYDTTGRDFTKYLQ